MRELDKAMHYDRDGNPITLERWIELYEADPESRRVAKTTIGSYLISTVWLGLDHSMFGDPPLIFETMVFPTVAGEMVPTEYDCWRYSTEADARAGHEEVVTLLRAAVQLDLDELYDEGDSR